MLEVISSDWKMWLGSKIVIGFATGIMQSVVPTYVAEVAPRELRAIYLSFFNMCSESTRSRINRIHRISLQRTADTVFQ